MLRVLLAPLVLLASFAAAPAAAQWGGSSSDNERTTSGHTRSRGSSASSGSGRERDDHHDDNDDYDDDDDDYDHRRHHHHGRSALGLALTLGVSGAVFDADLMGLYGDRTAGADDVAAGALLTLGFDGRLLFVVDEARFGLGGGGGTVAAPLAQPSLDGARFESGSVLGDGYFWELVAFGGYTPRLSELVQLYLGARVGLYVLELGVESNGRRYASVGQTALSAGPEVELRIGLRQLAFVAQAFVDLALPGRAELVLSLELGV